MKIAYASDLHVEINGTHRADLKTFPDADVLVLAGDILCARYLNKNRTDKESRLIMNYANYLIEEVFPRYRKVLYVLGNHEFYRFSFNYAISKTREYFQDVPNFHLMHNDTLEVDDLRFIGATLWTNFNNSSPIAMESARIGMNDFRVIYPDAFGTTPITPEFILNEHKRSLSYIEEILRLNADQKTIIVTHHGPSFQSLNPRHSGNALDHAYASDLSELILDNENILYWIHGHTHSNINYKIGKTNIVMNQMGYYIEKMDPPFDMNRIIEI